MNFGENLKKVREEKAFSQESLAKKVNIQGSHISRYERGLVSPSADIVIKLSSALDVSADELLFGDIQSDITDGYLDRSMTERLKKFQQLNEKDKKLVIEFLDAFLTKKQLENIMQ